MHNIFATSVWLYLGDALFVTFLIIGTASAIGRTALILKRTLTLSIPQHAIKPLITFQIVWLTTGLILFKAIILMGGPGWSHNVGTGNHGSVQFSTAGEAIAAITTAAGLYLTIKNLTRLGIVTLRPRSGACAPSIKGAE